MTRLTELAERAGISTHWTDVHGVGHAVGEPTMRHLLGALDIEAQDDASVADGLQRLDAHAGMHAALTVLRSGQPLRDVTSPGFRYRVTGIDSVGEGRVDADGGVALPTRPGYYTVETGETTREVAVAPLPNVRPPLGFGVAAQVYGLRRSGDGGVGDYSAVARVAERAAANGADAVAISPVHAMFAREPWRASPYSPSSRRFFNAYLADPAARLGEPALRDALAALDAAEAWAQYERAPLIEWDRAGELRRRVLETLYSQCRARDGADWRAFTAWREGAGTALQSHARFEALDVAYPTGDWRVWPADLRQPVSQAVERFEAIHPTEIASHAFAQWLAEEGLRDAQQRARAAGMTIGLIADLAVGVDPRGSDGWNEPGAFLQGVSVGAPPDLLAPQGQSWGLTTFAPNALRSSGYAPFVAMVRSALRHAGGLRIDHILGLQRLWLVPEGRDASDGAYVSYPREDLLGLLALEAHLGGHLLIGEDLGTVPEGFRGHLAANGILGMSVLMFERDGERYRSAASWRDDAVGLTTTHDLPTLAGWWVGRDLQWRRDLDLIDDAALQAQREERARDRTAMTTQLIADHALGIEDGDPSVESFVDAAIAHVANTPSPLALVPLEDLTSTVEQPNLPGTTSGHPNWRRRFDDDVDALFDRTDVRRRLEALAQRRPRT